MNRTLNVRAALVLVVVLLSLWGLYPTWKSMHVTDEMRQRAKTDPELAQKIEKWDAKAIRKGLDLSGGMYIVLEVDTEGMTTAEAKDALDRVVEILRNRVDQFGVSEPDIKPMGTKRIIVQLPGLQDVERAKKLIGSTARLEFRLVRTDDEIDAVLKKLDDAFRVTLPDSLTAAADSSARAAAATAADDSTLVPGADDTLALANLPGENETEADRFAPTPEEIREHPFSAYVVNDPGLKRYTGSPLVVMKPFVDKVQKMLHSPEARVIPRSMTFQFGMNEMDLGNGTKGRPLFLLSSRPGLTGDRLTTARSGPDSQHPGNFIVNMSMDRKGARLFARLTAENVGRQLAISLDGKVNSAPTIQGKIPGGHAQITGHFTSAQAQDLSLLLRAGALPVDVHIEQERTVGPSLGADSIHQGMRAGLYGLIVVLLFVLIYYKLTGLVVNLALLVNMVILLAVLAQFGLVLTLPGIAGIILTIGMAVDANVLINERIREELRLGKTSRAAVEAGYRNATRTIVDANVTTLIAAGVLLWFGTGPILGFAVTLSIGILSSMFTALVMTRVIMEWWTQNHPGGKLSI